MLKGAIHVLTPGNGLKEMRLCSRWKWFQEYSCRAWYCTTFPQISLGVPLALVPCFEVNK
jgi:hypothetical protein